MFSMRPQTLIFIICAMPTAFRTIMPTSSCGVVTTMMPSTGRDWKTVSGTSPVPGGMSMNMQSTSPQLTSDQNCWSTSVITGLLQMTGWFSSCIMRFMDMILIPVAVTAGRSPFSSAARSAGVTPNIFGMLGPVISASRIAVL